MVFLRTRRHGLRALVLLPILLSGGACGNASQAPTSPAQDAQTSVSPPVGPPPGGLLDDQPHSHRLHGLGFSPFLNGVDPTQGGSVTFQQVQDLLELVRDDTEWVRTWSTGNGNGVEHVGPIAHAMGLKVAGGAWIGTDPVLNGFEVAAVIQQAILGDIDLAIVGSESLLRNDVTPQELIGYLDEVRAAVPPHVQVTTADVYSEYLEHPEVIDHVDFLFVNIYPFWEAVPIQDAVDSLHCSYRRTVAAAQGKEVVISEAGWPSQGSPIGAAVPSEANAAAFFQEFASWARYFGVDTFYFEAFDEDWKTDEGDFGPHWGIRYDDGSLKPGMQEVFDGQFFGGEWLDDPIPGGAGTPDLELTSVPPIGSFSNLLGQVWHVDPHQHGVAVYIKVNGVWWTKPHDWAPWTDPACDGSWVADITTGGVDETATEVAAFLLPRGFDLDAYVVTGNLINLPNDLFVEALDFEVVLR